MSGIRSRSFLFNRDNELGSERFKREREETRLENLCFDRDDRGRGNTIIPVSGRELLDYLGDR